MNNKAKAILILTTLTSAMAVYYGFFGIDKVRMEQYYNSYTWYFLAFALFLWVQRCFSLLPVPAEIRQRLNRHLWPGLLAAGLSVAAMFASPPDFRILADETNLLSMAMAMYDEHACTNPTQMVSYYHGMRRVISQVTDMRPGLFPFAVSALHSLTGYRPENAFAVNAMAGFACLFLVYYLIQLFWGRFWGTVAMLLLGSFPVFVLYMTSAGFEVFNLAFVLVFLLLLNNFIRTATAGNAEALLLLLPLLAQTRYESALALFCAVPVILRRLHASEYGNFSLRLVILPLFFLPVAWLRVVTFSQQAFQVSSIDQAFGFDLFVKNIRRALPFFSGSERAYGMVPIIFFMSVAGFVWVFFDWQARHCETAKDRQAALTYRADRLFLLAGAWLFTLHAAARFAYYWGDMTLQYTSRLGIVFLPVLVFLAVYLLRRLTVMFAWNRGWAAIMAVLVLLHGWPAAGQNLAVRDILFYREFKTVREFLERNFPDRKDYIVVTEQSNAMTPLRYNTFTIGHLNACADQIKQDLKNRTWRYLIVVQKIENDTGRCVDNSEVNPGFVLETLYESQLSINRKLRISKHIPE